MTLPDDGGRTTWTFRVTGLTGFLVAKTAALVGRDKPKDAYDIVWLLENWPDGAEGAAATVSDSGLLQRSDVIRSLRRLKTEFSETDRLGPASYVRFMASGGALTDERLRLARQAMGAVLRVRRRPSHPPGVRLRLGRPTLLRPWQPG